MFTLIDRYYSAVVNVGSILVIVGIFADNLGSVGTAMVTAGVAFVVTAYIARLMTDSAEDQTVELSTASQSHALAQHDAEGLVVLPTDLSEVRAQEDPSVTKPDLRATIEQWRRLFDSSHAVWELRLASVYADYLRAEQLSISKHVKKEAALIRELCEKNRGDVEYQFLWYDDGRFEIVARKRESLDPHPATHQQRLTPLETVH